LIQCQYNKSSRIKKKSASNLGPECGEYEKYGVVGQFCGRKPEFRKALVSFQNLKRVFPKEP
jgi:hypothetical protein